jgi:hypothetical protein
MKRSIVRNGYTFRGTVVVDRGVFTDRSGETYAGHIKDGFACGLGVTACSGSIIYAEHGPDGKFDGRYVDQSTGGMFTGYVVFERGEDVWLTASNGRRYLDFIAGIAVNALGPAQRTGISNPPRRQVWFV